MLALKVIVAGLIALVSVQARAAPSSIKLTVDPRIELMGVIQLLYSDYPIVTQYDFAYKKLVLQRFAPFKDHRAVQLFKEMSPNGFSFDAPLAVMLHLSDLPGLKVKHPPSEALIRRAGGQEKLDEFVVALRNFAEQAEFSRFFRQQRGFYAQILSGEQQNLRGIDIRVVERYYGTKQFQGQIALHSSLLTPISEHMRREGYGDWETVVNEHIVRAVTVRLAYRERGQPAGDEALISEKKRGFEYIEALCDQLKHYENNRRRYPTFASFYPEIVTTLEVLVERHQ